MMNERQRQASGDRLRASGQADGNGGRGLVAGPAACALWLGLLLALAASAFSATTTTAYRCKVGEAPERLETPPRAVPAQTLNNLRQWDAFAVRSIARAVRGQAPLRDVFPLFETLLQSGPFAGTFGAKAPGIDPFLGLRGKRLLDAARRLAAGPPLDLVRELLADGELIAQMRKGGLGDARAGGELVFTKYLYSGEDIGGWSRFIPLFLNARESLADRELASSCLRGIDEGKASSDAATFLGRTFLWDLRLYLVGKPKDSDIAAALRMPADRLRADLIGGVSAAHLRQFLFGGPKASAGDSRWRAFEAERFIAERPDYEWVGHAAALLHELAHGTVLKATGEARPERPATGLTMPTTYVVEPAEGATYAAPALVWPQSPDVNYGGVRCVEETRVVTYPPPIGGSPTPAGLRYIIVFTKLGAQRLTFQYKLYGLELPMVAHVVDVAQGFGFDGSRRGEDLAGWAPAPVIIELTAPPNGYRPVYNSNEPVLPGQARHINGGRKFFEFADGEHGMEHLILYEVCVSDEDHFPEEFVYCDPNPRGDRSIVEKAIAEAEEVFPRSLRGIFALAPRRARVLGRDCWVARKGKGPDGKRYYVLCKGTETYHKRSEMFLYQRYWDALIGEQDIYDSMKIKDDTVAYAEAVLAALRVVGTGGPRPVSTAASATRALAFLKELRDILSEDANLRNRLSLLVAAWRQKTVAGEMAAKSVAEDIVTGYEVLTARAASAQPPDSSLSAVLNGLNTALGIGTAASHLVEKGLRTGEDEKVNKGVSLLQGYEAERQELHTRIMTLDLQCRGVGGE